MTTICRDCGRFIEPISQAKTCPRCGAQRLISHDELAELSMAHIDCDAFYASVEKRDDPEIRGKPVIVGGGRRGVVAACCYIARIYGVRSAMPMFKALAACPDAVVIRPNMEKYRTVGVEVRQMMNSVTPMVEPLSIDEAFLDLSGTARLHHAAPAETLARLALRIEKEIGINISIGLSYNKFLAKLASDLDKPKGFSVIGAAESVGFLSDKPVSLLWGVGKALQKKLDQDGFTKIGQLRNKEEAELVARYGSIGSRLHRFANGKDVRQVDPISRSKSISSETTFEDDIDDLDTLRVVLWRQCEKVALRLIHADKACDGIQLKLKTHDFKLITRSRKLPGPTKLADDIFATAEQLLRGELDGRRRFRLLGVGAERLVDAALADQPDLADPDRERRVKVADALNVVRAKFGNAAIGKGRGFKP